MTPFFRSLRRVGGAFRTMTDRVGQALGRVFLSKTLFARRASTRFEESQRRALELERLDRLRNPSDYLGK